MNDEFDNDYVLNILCENCNRLNFKLSSGHGRFYQNSNYAVYRKEDGLLMGTVTKINDNIYEITGSTTVSEYRRTIFLTDSNFHDKLKNFLQSLKDHPHYKLGVQYD